MRGRCSGLLGILSGQHLTADELHTRSELLLQVTRRCAAATNWGEGPAAAEAHALQAARYSMSAQQPEAAEVFLGQALSRQADLEAAAAGAHGADGIEAPLTLLFDLVSARLQNAWTLGQQVRRRGCLPRVDGVGSC